MQTISNFCHLPNPQSPIPKPPLSPDFNALRKKKADSVHVASQLHNINEVHYPMLSAQRVSIPGSYLRSPCPPPSQIAEKRVPKTVRSGHNTLLSDIATHKIFSGCLTCRIRKVKCDEQRPVCKRCENSPNRCEWLEPGQALSARGKGVSSPAYGSPRFLASSESPASFDSGSPASPASYEGQRVNLSAAHVPLANSLQLSEQDRAAFAYIPYSTMVVSYGKLWPWSCFSYIYANIASLYPGVMRSFIAVANMELRAKDLLEASASSERASRLGASAAVHYTQALKDLSSLLDRICQTPEQDCDIDALFTMWFLIMRYEACDSETTGASLLHLDGIRLFLRPYLRDDGQATEKKLPCVAQAMLLYTL
jgi:hypothetical protein